jgi:hypothetical protein
MPLRLFLGFQPYVTHAKKKNNSGKLKFISKKTVLVLLSVVFHECSFSPVVIFGHTDSFSPAASFLLAQTDRNSDGADASRFSLAQSPEPQTLTPTLAVPLCSAILPRPRPAPSSRGFPPSPWRTTTPRISCPPVRASPPFPPLFWMRCERLLVVFGASGVYA